MIFDDNKNFSYFVLENLLFLSLKFWLSLILFDKTLSDINKFRSSAFRYNYDSQEYIYKQLFGYDFIFIVIDKSTNQIGLFECSEEFLRSGQRKVEKASEVYNLFFKDKDFDPSQYFIS